MEIIEINYPFENFKIDFPVVVTMGEFDGLHIGHIKLIEAVKFLSNEKKCKSVLITFNIHPDFILSKIDKIEYITPINRKIELLKKIDIDYLIVINFNNELAKISHEIFAEQLSKCLNIVSFVSGDDFKYGYNGYGNVKTINDDFHTSVFISPTLTHNNYKIGSSLIKYLIKNGEIEQANKFCYQNYTIEGLVIRGKQLGRTYNFPTANLKILDHYIIPNLGVYKVYVKFNENKYLGICNIGHNPTFNYSSQLSIEVHLIDYDGDLYDKMIKIEFIKFMRNEIKFKDKNELIKQLQFDVMQARQN